MYAGGTALNYALHSFVWHSSTASKDDYKKGEMKSGDTNWWSMAHSFGHYSAIGILGTAFVTQALAMGGMAVHLNHLVWHYGAHFVLLIIEYIATLMNILAYDKAHTYLDGGSTDLTVLSNAGVVFGGALGDFIEHQAHFVVGELAMWSTAEDWELSQWLASTPEEQEHMIEELEEKYAKIEEQFGVGVEGAEKEEEEGEEAEEGEEGEEAEEGEEGEDAEEGGEEE